MHPVRLLLCAVLLLPGTAHGQEARLEYNETESVLDFDPHRLRIQRGTSDRLFSMLYEGLVRYDHITETFVPVLATGWALRGDRLTFRLRPDVTWHDGSAFTASDVVFTYTYLQRVGRRGLDGYYQDLIQRIEADDTQTVTVQFRVAPASEREALAPFDAWLLPAHRFERFMPAPGVSSEPVGTGPYRVARVTLDGSIELQAWRDHWQGPPRIPQVRMERVTDPTTLVLYTLYGAKQLIIETPPDDLPLVESSGEFTFVPYNSYSMHAFVHNLTHPLLQDVRIRRALTHALDRERLLEQWYAGRGHVLAGPFNQFTPYFDPSLRPLPHDPAAAQRLLGEAGLADRDGDGVLETPRGRDVTLRLITLEQSVASTTVNQNVAKSFADALRPLGVHLDVQALKLDQYNQALQDRDFDIAWVKWEFDPTYDVAPLFASDGAYNLNEFQNGEVDEVLRLFREETDPEGRQALMRRLQHLLANEAPYTFLYSTDSYAAVRITLLNVTIDPFYFFTHARDWYLDPAY